MGAGSDAPGTLARRLLDGIPLALVLLDRDARVQLANAAAGALFDGDGGALAGRALVELFDEDAATLERALTAARHHLEPATPAAAALVLSQLLAPAREVLGTEAGEAVNVAARAARIHL